MSSALRDSVQTLSRDFTLAIQLRNARPRAVFAPKKCPYQLTFHFAPLFADPLGVKKSPDVEAAEHFFKKLDNAEHLLCYGSHGRTRDSAARDVVLESDIGEENFRLVETNIFGFN